MSVPLTILGAGVSGLAATRLAASEGRGGVVISENHPEDSVLAELKDLGFSWRADLPEVIEGEVVLSPGIPSHHPWIKTLRAVGQGVIPEFEWGASRLLGTQIAVTGSLGKTSMVMLAADLLRDAGYSVSISGNIGTPVSEIAVKKPEADFHVIELSSFQLESLQSYRPDRALCLNLVPNHLDRHATLEEYAEAKARLFSFQMPEDVSVWPKHYPVEVHSRAQRLFGEDMDLPTFGTSRFNSSGLRKNLQGLFAVLEGIPGVSAKGQREIVDRFVFPAHRMETLNIPGAGVVINDSKSTCLTATRGALEAISGDIQLIMGGVGKNESLENLKPLLMKKNPKLYLFGDSAKKMREAWKDSVDECLTFDNLENILPVLWDARTPSQTLLFSPGCASFDHYEGYVARGQHFQKLVSKQAAEFPLY